ncbi:MAG: carboxypeptidase-like regulatory domain-containing protein, partial [Planctomycetota bacterium]
LPGRERTILLGHVYGPDGRPVEKAEVRVVYPKTFTLVRTADNGAYELPFEKSGSFLVEAALTIEFAPERAWAEVPEHGDPVPLDFRLKPAGAIFGEVTLAGVPVGDAGVELYVIDLFGDAEPVHDTSARNGYFNFYFDPPKDVPLRLDVKSDEGILRTPLQFAWKGEQMNTGRIDLVPYPSLRIRMRLPDGSYAPEVSTCRPEDLEPSPLWGHGGVPPTWQFVPARFLGTRSRVAIPEEKDLTMRLVFVGTERSGGEDTEEEPRTFMVEREVDLAFGRVRELDLVVRPGPFTVTSRLVDERARPVHARLALGDREATTLGDGTFQIAVPHGGLHTVRIAALEAPGFGWVDLDPDAREHRLLLDADDRRDTVLDLGARVVVVTTVPAWVELEGPGLEFSPLKPLGATLARLSSKLDSGTYGWRRGTIRIDAEGRSDLDPASGSGLVTIEDAILSVVDAR